MDLVLYNLIPVALGIVFLILLAGLINMLRGGSASTSQKLMRARVIMQAVAIAIILGAVYLLKS